MRAFVLVGPSVRATSVAPAESLAHAEFNGPLGVQLPISRQFAQLVRIGLAVPEGSGVEHLVPYCFPERLSVPDAHTGALASYVHTFAAERPDGDTDHAACLTTLFPNRQAGPGAVVPVCLVVASTHPLYRVFTLFLQQMAEEHAQHGRLLPAAPELRDQLVRLVSSLNELGAHTERLFADGLHPRFSLLPLMRALRWQGDTLVRLWLAALLHGKVLLGSADTAMRNVAVHDVQTLLLPMGFNGFVLPMLPTTDGGADFVAFLCHSPSPYLVGCDPATLQRVLANARDVSALDLDSGAFYPSASNARLHEQLLGSPALVNLRALLRAHACDERVFDETEVRSAFLCAALSLADPLSADGALGCSRSELDRGVVRHWKLLSSCANVLQRRVLRLCAATNVGVDPAELSLTATSTRVRLLPELCLAELARSGAGASMVEGVQSEHALQLVSEVVASPAFQCLHGGAAASASGAAERRAEQAWRLTAPWARSPSDLFVRLRERTVALQLLGHQLLTHLLGSGVRIKLPPGTWAPLLRRGQRSEARPLAPADRRLRARAEVDSPQSGQTVTSTDVADFQRRFSVEETPVADYECGLTVVPSGQGPALAGAGGGAQRSDSSRGRLFMTSDSLCYIPRGTGSLLRLPLAQIHSVEKSGGGRFTPRGILVRTQDGAVLHFTALPTLGQERAFAFVQYLQSNAIARAEALRLELEASRLAGMRDPVEMQRQRSDANDPRAEKDRGPAVPRQQR